MQYWLSLPQTQPYMLLSIPLISASHWQQSLAWPACGSSALAGETISSKASKLLSICLPMSGPAGRFLVAGLCEKPRRACFDSELGLLQPGSVMGKAGFVQGLKQVDADGSPGLVCVNITHDHCLLEPGVQRWARGNTESRR